MGYPKFEIGEWYHVRNNTIMLVNIEAIEWTGETWDYTLDSGSVVLEPQLNLVDSFDEAVSLVISDI